MTTINLADAKVSYEGQNVPAINLLAKLQTQLQEVACRLATIASAVGDLQAALLDSETIEVKLTFSRDDFARLRSLTGGDDGERIRKAVMALIHPGEAASPSASAEFRPSTAKDAEPAQYPQPQPSAAEPPVNKRSTTNCPSCQHPIDLPEMPNVLWSVEIQCRNCGAKSLVKSKTAAADKTDKTNVVSPDATGYKKLFDALSG